MQLQGSNRVLVRLGAASRVMLAVAMCLTLIAALPAAAHATEATWVGEYYNNTWLGSPSVLVRNDADVNFDWGNGSPGAGVAADNFSVRWTRAVTFAAGTYVFTMRVDDGGRLWVDNNLVLDKWFDQASATYQVSLNLTAGDHYLRFEYYERLDKAIAALSWASASVPSGEQWTGEYYSNSWFGGPAVVTRGDPAINFNWGSGAPASGVPADNFTVRWTRTVNLSAGTYVFSATIDDGGRLWVDDVLVLDKWFDQAANTYQVSRYLNSGTHTLRFDYYEHLGQAVAIVSWAPASAPPPASSEVIVDNLSAGFHRNGPAAGWRDSYCGYGGHIISTQNATYQVQNYATWSPALPQAGTYGVYAFIPACSANTTNAGYRVYHAGVWNQVNINQLIYSDAFVKLGSFYFTADGSEYVYLPDNTGEPYLSRRIGFDAIKFVLEGTPAPPPTGCSIVPQLGFGRVWNNNPTVRSKIGCALVAEYNIGATEEVFVGGVMFWREDLNVIYVLYNSGTWQRFPDSWVAGALECDPSIVPPPGFYQPVRGFGKVWRENGQVRAGLGWARAPETGLRLAWEDFERGAMLWSNDLGNYVLYNDGTWAHYN